MVVMLAALPFLTALRDPFFSDDYLHIDRLQVVRMETLGAALRSWVLGAQDLPAWWTPPTLAIPYFRPLVTLSFLLDHTLWGLKPFGYHLTNLLLHVCMTLLCLSIARRLLRSPFSAWAAAVMFALHPCHTEAVSWISGRTDLLAGVLCGAAFYAHLSARPLAMPRSLSWLAVALFCYLLALAAKEMALSLPLIVLAHNLFYPQGERLRRRLLVPALLLLVSVPYLGLRTALLGHATPPHPFVHGLGDPDMLLRIGSALPLYLADLLLFVPTEPVVTYPFWMRHLVLLALFCAFTVYSLVSAVRESQDRAASRFAVCFMLLSLLPVLPVTVGERFLYLPSLGFALLVGAKLSKAPRPAWPMLSLLVFVFAVVTGKAWQFSALSRSARQILDEAVAAVDRAPRARQLLIVDMPAQSALAFEHAIRLERPERSIELELLSIAPHFLSVDADFRSTVAYRGDDLLIRSHGRPYLSSYIEQAYLGGRPPLTVGELIARPGFQVRVTDVSADGADLRAFTVLFSPGSADSRLILRGQGLHLVRL